MTSASRFAAGSAVELTRVGGGSLMTPSSIGVTAMGNDPWFAGLRPRLGSARTVGADIAHAVPLTLRAAIHASLGHMYRTLPARLLRVRCRASGPLRGRSARRPNAWSAPDRAHRIVTAGVKVIG